jgi:peptidoglycan/xylan/chitin deacetylase (PgdA/CDA1 family)
VKSVRETLTLPTQWHRPHWRLLCYHGVPAGCTSSFEAQLRCLECLGFAFVTVSEGLLRAREHNLSRHLLSVTFDDVEASTFTQGMPILERFGAKVTLYVTASYAKSRTCHRTTPAQEAMPPEQLREAINMGHEIAAHTLTHAPLKYCSDRRVRQELEVSKELLDEWCRCEIRHFAYPWGQHSRRTRRLIVNSGLYESAATIERGMMGQCIDPYALRRDSIDPGYTPQKMLRLMRLADHWNWVARLLRVFKRPSWRNLEAWKELPRAEIDPLYKQ